MECSNSLDTNPSLGLQSSDYVSGADPDAKLPDQTLELRKEVTHNKLFLKDGEDAQTTADSFVVEKVQEELEKQLRLNEEIDDRDTFDWNQDEDFKSGYSNGGEEEYNIDYNKEDNDDDDEDDDDERKDERSNGNRRHQYPVRPEAEDCSYYMKTGTCKFGSNCKFNHPVRRKNQVTKEREEQTERPGQTECKYYLRTGGCKYGKACRYNHSRAKQPLGLQAKPTVFPALDLNFLGLPIRPGEKECPYYMRNGSCKYGANCRFNHPDPTAVGGSDAPPPAFSNGSASLQKSSQPSVASWSTPRGLNETAPFVPIMFPPTQAVPPQSPEWNGYQAPVYPPERSIHPPPAYVMTPAVDANVYAHQQPMPVDEFPERPGQPECSYYMKTGDCKFKSNCKYHHPKNQMSKSPPCELSDKGLPLRPGQNICSYYKRYGICKFGPACKFDHSIQPASTMGSTDDQGTPYGDSIAIEEGRMVETGNGSESAI